MNDPIAVWKEIGSRKYYRGFGEFYSELFKILQPEKLCEFGIGGGGNHSGWAQIGIKNILGLEYLSYPEIELGPNGKRLEGEIREYWTTQLKKSQATLENTRAVYPDCNIEFMYGVDAYDYRQVQEKVTESGQGKFDIVIDDGGDKWPNMLPGLDAWKPHINSGGVFVSETPDGNGTPYWRNFTYEEHIQHFQEYAQKGLRVYDMSEYQPEEYRNDIDYSSRFLGFWTADFSKFENITEKFKHCRVA